MTIIGWFLIVTLKWAFKHRKQFSKIKNWLIVEIKCHLFKLSWRVYAHLCIGFIVFPFRIFFLLLDVLHRHLQQRFFPLGAPMECMFPVSCWHAVLSGPKPLSFTPFVLIHPCIRNEKCVYTTNSINVAVVVRFFTTNNLKLYFKLNVSMVYWKTNEAHIKYWCVFEQPDSIYISPNSRKSSFSTDSYA